MSEGTYLRYVNKEFSDKKLALIGIVNRVIKSYQAKGLNMTLRQIHYQLVGIEQARDLDYLNTTAKYKMLGDLVSDGRLAGLIDWNAVEDLQRTLYGHSYHEDPIDVFKGLDGVFRRNKWREQDWYPVVGVEKQALQGVIGQICEGLEVPYIAFKGYSSQSTTWRLGRRFASAINRGQRPILFHLGDFDSSGWDMTRDLQERLSLFAGTQIIVQRLGLNPPQVEEHDLLPNPVKSTDSRADKFIEEHGDASYELDAVDSLTIQRWISDAVLMLRDETRWDAALAQEADEKILIRSMIESLGINPDPDEEDEEN